MGEDDTLKRMKKALAGSHPDLSRDSVVSSYQALAKAEDAALLAELNIALSEDESDDAEDAEEVVPTDAVRSQELTGSTSDQTDPPAA